MYCIVMLLTHWLATLDRIVPRKLLKDKYTERNRKNCNSIVLIKYRSCYPSSVQRIHFQVSQSFLCKLGIHLCCGCPCMPLCNNMNSFVGGPCAGIELRKLNNWGGGGSARHASNDTDTFNKNHTPYF